MEAQLYLTITKRQPRPEGSVIGFNVQRAQGVLSGFSSWAWALHKPKWLLSCGDSPAMSSTGLLILTLTGAVALAERSVL